MRIRPEQSIVLKLISRLLAWLSFSVLLFVFLILLVLAKLPAYFPTLVSHAESRLGTEISYDELRLDWIDGNFVFDVTNLAVSRLLSDQGFEFASERTQVHVGLPTADRLRWTISNVSIYRPKIVTQYATRDRSSSPTPSAPTDLDSEEPFDVESLFIIEQLSVVDGEYEVRYHNGQQLISLLGGFSVDGHRTSERAEVAAKFTSSENKKTEINLDVVRKFPPGGDEKTDLDLVVNSVELIRLLPFFANHPRLASVDLSELETTLSAAVFGKWVKKQLESVLMSVELQDSTLHGTIDNAEQATFKASASFGITDNEIDSVKAKFELESLDLHRTLQQFPEAFPPKFYAHASDRVKGLWINEISGTLSGNPQTLFQGGDDWRLEATGEISNFTYRFSDKWPSLEQAAGKVTISETKLVLSSTKGSVHGIEGGQMVAAIEDFTVEDPIMEVGVGLEFPMTAAVDLFGKDGVVSPGKMGPLSKASGTGQLHLDVKVPLRRGKEFTLMGVVDTESAGFATPQGVELKDVSGHLRFNRVGITTGNLTGELLGGPFSANVNGSGDKGNYVFIGNAKGVAEADRLGRVVGASVAQHLSGKFDWTSTLNIGGGTSELTFSTPLKGVSSSLPAPMRKSKDITLPFEFRSLTQGKTERIVHLDFTPLVAATLNSEFVDQQWKVQSGQFAVGKPLPMASDKAGVTVSVNLPYINYEAWSDMIDDSESEFGVAYSDALSAVSIKANELVIGGQRSFLNAEINGTKYSDHWQVEIMSDEVVGIAQYKSRDLIAAGEVPSIEGEFTRCRIPQSIGSATKRVTDPRTLPALSIRCQDTQYGQFALGQSVIEGSPDEDGWAVTRAHFETSTFVVDASAKWHQSQSSELKFRFASEDFGQSLDKLAISSRFSQGKSEIDGELKWDNALTRWSTQQTSGRVNLRSEGGAIVSDENSEVFKVLGALNYETIFGRTSQGLADVVREDGFLYDQLLGSAELENGVFQIDGIVARGPAMSVVVTGSSDWNNRTHDLKMGVEPKVRKSLTTLATILINPFTGGLVYAGSKLADKIDLDFSYSYDITGSWSDPQVVPSQSDPQ